MKPSGKKPSLISYDEIFSTEESRADAQLERVQEIPLAELYDFKDHPFKVTDDEHMKETAESVKEHGVLVPAIARPLDGGGYELISGHRRKRAAQLAGLETLPVIVRDLDDDAATIIMVDSNLQRENILPSERAFAYKMKVEALKHQGSRTSVQVGQKLTSREQVASKAGESVTQVQRYIRLTNLVPELLELVDQRKLAFNPAVEISYLNDEEQYWLLEALESTQASPSLSQAQRMKKFSQDGRVSRDVLLAIMSEEKKPLVDSVTISNDTLKRYFPKDFSAKQMQDVILKLLDHWQKSRQAAQER